MSAGKACIVACDGVKLKLTCTDELLQKPLSECLIAPFLGVFNKKRGTTFKPEDLKKVEVDGKAVTDLSLTGAAVLGAIDAPSVVLFPPSCDAAVERVLLVDPSSSAPDDVAALKALRLEIKETPSAAAPALTPKVVALLAEISCLTPASAERTWTAASGEAAVCLNNLLAASREKAGALLCAPELGFVTQLSATFEAAQSKGLARLRLLSPLVFHVSLLPAVQPHATRLAAAVRACLSYLATALEMPNALPDELVGAALAAELLRATFNLLRLSSPDAASEGGAAVITDLVEIVATLLKAPGASEAATVALREAKCASLQIPVVIEPAYARLHVEWRAVCDLLHPLCVAAEAANAEDVTNQTVLPLLTLQKLAEANSATRDALKEHLFGEVASAPKNPDPYAPAGTMGWDPNVPLGSSASLRMHLLKLLTSTAFTAKHVAGNMLFAVCADNAEEFTHLCGLGSAAGLLSERGLFSSFQQSVGDGGAAQAQIEEIG